MKGFYQLKRKRAFNLKQIQGCIKDVMQQL